MIVTALHSLAVGAEPPVVDVVRQARQAGFDGVAVDLPTEVILDETCPDRLESVSDVVRVLGYPARGSATLTHDPVGARGVIRALITIAARAGAETVEIVAGGVGPCVSGAPIGYLDALHATYDGLLDLVGLAERHGVRLALSTEASGFLQSPVELRDLLERVNSHAACVALHWDTVPGDPLDWLSILGPKVATVRGGPAIVDGAEVIRRILDLCGADAVLTCVAAHDLLAAANALGGQAR